MIDNNEAYLKHIVSPARRVFYKEAILGLSLVFSQALPDVLGLLEEVIYDLEEKIKKESPKE